MYLTDARIKQLEKRFELVKRALVVLDLVAVEFKTDPQSTKCFDSRTVREVITVNDELKLYPEVF